ncbi:hypothetical protein BCS94_06840 [Vibrio breoganii]|uniref:DUF5681 domain-containing protein n=1 Tax=Vibrio breoganii TaxID=553239 RepID=UPI000C854230|nr:DUF5681 domain-containing protein [Vibrio breoganii]PMP08909.1 hypothetical protein BCS94_06840 [Vibrio breoganii]
MAFKKGETGNPNGRPKGSKNRKGQFSEKLSNEAIKKLEQAVADGESWAISLVIQRTHPALKAITPENSIDAEVMRARIFQLVELEERLTKLEQEEDAKQCH